MRIQDKKILFGALLLLFGLLTHFIFAGHPDEVVFDEVHYGKYASAYFEGKHYFSGHPPLGVEMIALGGWLSGYEPPLAFDHIGEKFDNDSYTALRLMPRVAGALVPPVVYILAMVLGMSVGWAFLAGFLLVFENALLVQSRFILIDPFLILFGFLGLTLFFLARRQNYSLRYLIPAGVFLGMSVAVKWSAVSFFLITGFVALWDVASAFLGKEGFPSFAKRTAGLCFCLLILPLLVYAASFYPHFKFSSGQQGPGDAFFSQEFLSGTKSFAGRVIEANKAMYYTNLKLTAGHPYASKPYTWPLMARPIYYWTDGNSRIYLLGNPAIWWSSGIAIFLLAFFAVRKRFKDPVANILLSGYIFSLLPFFGVQRILFLYHYLPAIIFAVMALVYLISRIKHSKFIFPILFLFSVLAFLYFAPLSYGLPLATEQYENRVWFESWR